MLLRIHLKDLNLPDLTTCRISLNPNVVYLGKPISDVVSSVFYRDLPLTDYKIWLKEEIESQAYLYQALTELKDLLLNAPSTLVLFVCDCEEEENRCRATALKKAIAYLIVKDWPYDWAFNDS